MEKLTVNDTCIGCGLCVAENDKYFEFNDEGFSKVKQEIVEEADKKDILNNIEACPSESIVIEEEKEA